MLKFSKNSFSGGTKYFIEETMLYKVMERVRAFTVMNEYLHLLFPKDIVHSKEVGW